METFRPPRPAIDLSTHLHHQLVYTVTGQVPPPPFDEARAACKALKTEAYFSKNETNSQDVAFETLLSEQLWNRQGSDETQPPEIVREASAKSVRPVGHCLRTVVKVPERRTMAVIRTKSHYTAFETELSKQPGSRGEPSASI